MKEGKFEVYAAVVVLVLSAGCLVRGLLVSKELWYVGGVAGVLASLMVLNTSLLKVYFKKEIAKMTTSSELRRAIETMDGVRFHYADRVYDKCCEDIKSIGHGVIPLVDKQYFQDITDAMGNAKAGDVVLACSRWDERRWHGYAYQTEYWKANRVAIANGAKVVRVFVLEKNATSKDGWQQRLAVMKEQSEAGVEVRVIEESCIPTDNTAVADAVLFPGRERSLFVAEPDKRDPIRVASARLLVSESDTVAFERDHRTLLATALTFGDFVRQLNR